MRKTTTQRGYGTQHQRERKKWQRILEHEGILPCASPTCTHPQDPITPDTPWDLGHTDDRQAWRGPEHPSCNRRAGAINSNKTKLRTPKLTIQDW